MHPSSRMSTCTAHSAEDFVMAMKGEQYDALVKLMRGDAESAGPFVSTIWSPIKTVIATRILLTILF